MRLAFLSMLLPVACLLFCQAFPMTKDDTNTALETPKKPSAFEKCCVKLHLSGEDSIFKNLIYCTGKDYKPPKNNTGPRRCCCCCSCKSKKNTPPHHDTEQSENSATTPTMPPPTHSTPTRPVYSSTSEIPPGAQKSNVAGNEIGTAAMAYELGRAHANHEAVIANEGVEGLSSVPSGSGVYVPDSAGFGVITGIQDTGAGTGVDAVGSATAAVAGAGDSSGGGGDCGGADVGECLCCMGGVVYKVVKFVVCDVGCCCFQQGCPCSGDC